MTCNSRTELVSEGALTPIIGITGQQDVLVAEIKRLRERLMGLETENTSLSEKLTKQQWNFDHRLAEIEMQIRSRTSSSSSIEDNERNRESII